MEDNEVEFIKKYVGSIVGSIDDGQINYDVDFLMTDEMEEMEESWQPSNGHFGSAPVKREGSTVTYDTKHRYTWEKDNGRK